MAKHYICTGDCNGVSSKPGSCRAAECINFNEPLEECDCGNGKHGQ